jgi:hypothetical protein
MIISMYALDTVFALSGISYICDYNLDVSLQGCVVLLGTRIVNC